MLMTYGGGGLGQCYIILGDLKYCYIMLYMVEEVVKKSTFLCYIICGRPLCQYATISSTDLPSRIYNTLFLINSQLAMYLTQYALF